jgi:hypothetical protein
MSGPKRKRTAISAIKIDFEAQTSAQAHLRPPDPLLLVSKSAVVWGSDVYTRWM